MKQFLVAMLGVTLCVTAGAEVKRTNSGVPDLSGFYDSGTLTPLNRPAALGDKQFLTKEEAAAFEKAATAAFDANHAPSDPDRAGAPPGFRRLPSVESGKRR